MPNYDENGNLTKYNYVSYKGHHVGYHFGTVTRIKSSVRAMRAITTTTML